MEQQQKEKDAREKKEKEEAEKREKQKYVKLKRACIRFKLDFRLFCYSLIQYYVKSKLLSNSIQNVFFGSTTLKLGRHYYCTGILYQQHNVTKLNMDIVITVLC